MKGKTSQYIETNTKKLGVHYSLFFFTLGK